MKRDFYEVLGVDKNASKADIKAAYRQQALAWHPDRNKAADAEEKFKEINEAYEVLSNDQKKSAYDQFGHAAFDPSSGGFGGRTYTDQSGPFTYTWSGGNNPFGSNTDFDFGGFSNPFDIFEQFFSASGSGGIFGNQSRRQQLTTYKIELSFIESVKGVEKEVKIDGKNKKIKIPAGVADGQQIRFQDFILYIDVKPDKLFQRDGNDIYVIQNISIKQAILGDDIQVPTLDGDLKIRIKPGTQSHTLVRLQGKGSPNVNGFGHGDFYIRLIVDIPQKLSSKQKQILNQLDL